MPSATSDMAIIGRQIRPRLERDDVVVLHEAGEQPDAGNAKGRDCAGREKNEDAACSSMIPRSSARWPVSRYSGMKRMMEDWKPRQERTAQDDHRRQTEHEGLPYSKPPIQRARKTWLGKAMAALAMRKIKKGQMGQSAGFGAVAARREDVVDAAGANRKARRASHPGRKPSGRFSPRKTARGTPRPLRHSLLIYRWSL